ncbi:hypothetical protein NPIL_493041 [Nephila pilipes]|uniref:Uncharacterized protein n=1 Tax=Nephila pilipes TaxID=299642 RepID=A0A8X6TG92_NEPPI|nr:hypothetical protein NPIL_493041 [Nephila pilipes]
MSILISSWCFVKNNSVSSWEASVGRESVIDPTAVAAGFTEDSPFAFSSTAFAVEGGGEVVGSLSASLVSMFDAMSRAQYEDGKPYGPQH